VYTPWRPESSRRWLALLLLWPALVVAAGPPVRPFGSDTWAEIQATVSRPAVVVFTTTDCVYCPAVIDDLGRAIHKARSSAKLLVVVMDGADQESEAVHNGHLQHADRVYAFDGNAAALRYGVDPAWRGTTPFVVLLPRAGAPSFHVGRPKRALLAALLKPAW
jgi:hypothetical protein